jgi:prepilin peptidase CpaA
MSLMLHQMLHLALWSVALVTLVASAWTDLRDRIIPNEFAGLTAACGIGLSLTLRPDETWIGMLVAVLALVGLGVIAHYGAIGGGDVKLISAATLLVPPAHIGQLIAFIALSGGLLSCAYLLARTTLRRSRAVAMLAEGDDGREAGGWFSNECARIATGGPMPYALAILGGVAGTIAGELPQCLSASFCSF